MTPKLMETLRKQAELVAKLTAGSISPAERADLDRLTKAIADATAPSPVRKTMPTIMTLAEFQKAATEIEAAMRVQPDPEMLALLKRNIEAVKLQGKSAGTDMVAVEVPVPEPPPDLGALVLSLGDRLTALESTIKMSFDGRTTTGIAMPPAAPATPAAPAADPAADPAAADPARGASPDPAPAVTKQEPGEMPAAAPTAAPAPGGLFQAMGLEAIDAMVVRFNELRSRMADGSLTRDDVRRLWDNQWPIRNIVDQSVEVLAKMDAAKGALEAVLPALQKLAEAEPPAETAPAAEKGVPAAAAPAEGDPAPVQKADPFAAIDQRPRADARDEYRLLKRMTGGK